MPPASDGDRAAVPPAGSPHMVVEVRADGGVVLTTPDGANALATLAAVCARIAEADRDGATVFVRGDLHAAAVASVVATIRRLAPAVVEQPSSPTPWRHRRSSLQTAAAAGLTAQVLDLAHRGVSPGGRGPHSPYRLAMRAGHTSTMRALRDAGAHVPSTSPPPSMPEAVVLRAYPAPWTAWALSSVALIGLVAVGFGQYLLAPLFVAIAILGYATVYWALANTTCAVERSLIARRRGRRWQGPIDIRSLEAIGMTPAGTVRMPVLWVLGQRAAGDRLDVFTASAFDAQQQRHLTDIDKLRFVSLYAAGGFMSPGLERLFASYITHPEAVTLGASAAARVWPPEIKRGQGGS